MSRISKKLNEARPKNYHQQSVYVAGYEYTPWKKWVFIAITILAVTLAIGILYIYNKSVQSSRKPAKTSVPNNVSQDIQTPQKIDLNKDVQNAELYKVVKVVDGDTIDVEINGKTERLRLIGIDTPETVDPRKPVQCFGKEASNKAKEKLDGKMVRLESDTSQGERDKYNRLLRYVYLEDGISFNKWMISEGYANEYTYGTPYKYQADYKLAQTNAKAGNNGLWSSTTCSGNTEQPATATPKPVASSPRPTASGNNCDSNYSPCVPNVSYDLNCDDISFSVRVIGTDRHRFDRDGDGLGCESN